MFPAIPRAKLLWGNIQTSFRGSPSNEINVTTLDAATLKLFLEEIDTIPTNGIEVTMNNGFIDEICPHYRC